MQLRERMLRTIRTQGKSDETFRTYWKYCERFIRFCRAEHGDWVHPSKAGRVEVEAFLSDMANRLDCSPTTQNVALQSLCYLYREVLGAPLQGVSAIRAKRPSYVREVLDVSDVSTLLEHLDGVPLLAAQLIYGCGLRISDVVGIRIKDISFERCQLHIRQGKGGKDRYTAFPAVLHESTRRQIESMRVLHRSDQSAGKPGVSLPYAWERKSPSSRMDFKWWYLFASDRYSKCPKSGLTLRHHRHRTHLGSEISRASKRAGIEKRVTSHVLRHSYATHANELGVDVSVLQQLLGHNDVRTTMIYVHANKDKATAARSPLESLLRHPPVKQNFRLHG